MSLGDSEVGGGDSIPAEVNEAFESVFGGSESDPEIAAADAEGGNTEAAELSAQDRENSRRRQNEQKDELAEEGLEGHDNEISPEDEGQTTDETEEQTEEKDEIEKVDPLAALDPNHVFAAQQLGLTPEKLAKLAATDPDLAAETVANLAETYNNLSRQFLVPAGPLGFPGIQAQPQQPAQQQSPTPKLDKFFQNLQQFTEANGQDLGDFASALRDELLAPVRHMMAEAEASREQARKTEAVTTMKSLSEKFGDFYGAKENALTPAQQQARGNLAMVADQLIAGARMQGRDLSITDAINRAHLMVANQFQRQTVRQEIKSNLQKRAKSITAKPTQRRDRISAGGPSKAAAESAISKFWADKGVDIDLD